MNTQLKIGDKVIFCNMAFNMGGSNFAIKNYVGAIESFSRNHKNKPMARVLWTNLKTGAQNMPATYELIYLEKLISPIEMLEACL